MTIVKSSKPIDKLKKGDEVKVDGKQLEVDAHYVLINHKTTKEMVIEVFDAKADKDFQIRYFNDQVETSMEFYELVSDVMYVRREAKKIEW